MSSLNGARVALLESRMSGELAELVRRHGGEPCCVPAVRERPVASGEQVGAFLDHVVSGDISVVVFLTGVGVRTLFGETERLRRLPELVAALQDVTVVCRGPKPSAVLRRYNIPVALSAQSPYTTPQLLDAMSGLSLIDTNVALIHYGERNAVLTDALHAHGARVEELLLYDWQLPQNLDELQHLVEDIISSRVDAIAFTSQVQIRHLFQIATQMNKQQELIEALNTTVVVASVGPVCTTALQHKGVTPDVEPEHPKMGPMVGALARFVGQEQQGTSGELRTEVQAVH